MITVDQMHEAIGLQRPLYWLNLNESADDNVDELQVCKILKTGSEQCGLFLVITARTLHADPKQDLNVTAYRWVDPANVYLTLPDALVDLLNVRHTQLGIAQLNVEAARSWLSDTQEKASND